jgi:alpha-tubulin suppressor-like RCC1 family protein
VLSLVVAAVVVNGAALSSAPVRAEVARGGLAGVSGFEGVVPGRVLDTRVGGSTVDGLFVGGGAVGAGGTVDLQVAGRAGVPVSGVGAVVVNVTGVRASGSTFVTVFPSGGSRPVTSNLNLVPGPATPNLVVVKVGAGGRISLFNDSGSVDLLVDVMGWFPTGAGGPEPTVSCPPIAAGSSHSLVLKSDGTVWSFGNATDVQLGRTTFNIVNPVPGEVMSDASAVAAGGKHSLVLKSDGTVWSFGTNSSGQLGTNGTASILPVQVMSDASAVAAGAEHSLVLKSDGTVWSFGTNSVGQLGTSANIGTRTPNPVPVQVMSDASAVAAGSNHSLVLKSDGTVWSFGTNSSGQLGSNGGTVNPVPVQVMSGASAVAAGGSHSLVLKSDGTVWSFGNNSDRQLGANGGNLPANPVPVQVMSGASAVAAGGRHSLVLTSDGTVWKFGSFFGLIYAVPQQVMSGAAAVAAGGSHALVLKSDGTVWSFGNNEHGQMGTSANTGSGLDNRMPVEVMSGVSRGELFEAVPASM